MVKQLSSLTSRADSRRASHELAAPFASTRRAAVWLAPNDVALGVYELPTEPPDAPREQAWNIALRLTAGPI